MRWGEGDFGFFSGQPPPLGIMDLPAFSRAIERRYSAVNNQFSTFEAMTWTVGLHGKRPEYRGREGRNAVITHDLHGWHP
jgi:hypothetical protein